jgi:hypothetical protein
MECLIPVNIQKLSGNKITAQPEKLAGIITIISG